MNRNFNQDYEFGKKNEKEILPIIREFFDDDIKLIKYTYSTYDYLGKKAKYELKSRTNEINDYPTTLIPYLKTKCIFGKLIFLFKFTDGLYYIEYDKEEFNKFECKLFVRNKRNDYNDYPQFYYFIPNDKLKLIVL